MSRPVFCKLDQFGLLRFSGADAQAFLHAQLTCDVAALAPERATYGAYCTPKGRVVASFLLWRSGEDFFMQLPVPLLEPVRKQLAKFVLRSKVTIADVTADWMLIGVSGGEAPVQPAGGIAIPLPGNRFLVAVAKDKAPGLLATLAAGAEEKGTEYWDWLEVRAGIPVVTLATQELFVPQMLNLDLLGGVSYAKGCYPGQEIVARMHYRGTLKQRMYLAHAAGMEPPRPGDKLYSGDFGEQSCGAILNASPAPGGGFDALAVIQIAVARGDVHWRSPSGPGLELLPLPYPVDTER